MSAAALPPEGGAHALGEAIAQRPEGRPFSLSRLLVGALLALGATLAHAQSAAKVALLIANSAYAEAPLRNPGNDVREVAASLKALGFAVTVQEDLRLGPMREALRQFVLAHRAAEFRLVYFAGHGFQMRGRNYLLPVGARIDSESDVIERTADATELVEQLSAIEAGANVVIIDACRIHPLFAGSRRMWAVKRGLSRQPAPRGTIVAFSTRPGQVASDGKGPMSVYARHLTQALRQAPDLPIEALFKRVRAGVSAETERRQVPWEASDLDGDLCLRPDVKGRCASR